MLGAAPKLIEQLRVTDCKAQLVRDRFEKPGLDVGESTDLCSGSSHHAGGFSVVNDRENRNRAGLRNRLPQRFAIELREVVDHDGLAVLGHLAERILVEEDDTLQELSGAFDQYALEEGLKLAETSGGEVVAVSLGPDRVQDALRKALALGASRAVHLQDPAFSGGDAHATGRALAAAIRREEFDLVLTGAQSDDLGYGSTGSIVAGLLGWPHAWLVMGLEVEDGGGSARVTREMESGMNEIFRLKLPAVIEVQAGLNHPRYASLKGIMQAKRKPIDRPAPGDVGLAPEQLGSAGSRVEIVDVAFPESGGGAQIIEGDAATAAKTLIEKLRQEGIV